MKTIFLNPGVVVQDAGSGAMSRSRLDAHTLLEVNSIWQSVFDRSSNRQSSGSESGSKHPSGGYGLAEGRSVLGFDARSADFGAALSAPMFARRYATGPENDEPSPAPSADESMQELLAERDGVTQVSSLSNDTPRADVATGRVIAREPIELSDPAEGTDREVGEPPSDDLQQHEAVGKDCVSVFVQNGAVAVTVRDRRLSDLDAVRGAFQTARVLTGQGASLKQLLLNGRQLYQRSERDQKASASVRSFDA